MPDKETLDRAHEPATFGSADDVRTQIPDVVHAIAAKSASASAVRTSYRVLSDDEKKQMLEVKMLGAELIDYFHRIGGTEPGKPQGSRDLALAQTHLEDAVMRAVRHITG